MKPYVLERITPELILDFFEHFLPNYLLKYHDIVKVLKNDLPNEFTVELIPSTFNKIKCSLSSKIPSRNFIVTFETFKHYLYDTSFFSVTSCHYHIGNLWLTYLVQKFGFFNVFEEKENYVFIEHAAFIKEFTSSDSQSYLYHKKIARSIITDPEKAYKQAVRKTHFKLIGIATGYNNNETFSNKSYLSDSLTNSDRFSAVTQDKTTILINSFAKRPKFAARLL